MLRIAAIQGRKGTTVLRLAGRVAGPWVAELERVCDGLLARGHGLTLDLAEVSYVDQAGVALLRGLAPREVALASCSPFVTEQLKARAC